jgi:phosphatidylglycerophosphate synthase
MLSFIKITGNSDMPNFITESGLKQLDKYEYKSGKYTWLDNALQPYWEGVIKLMPLWVAPNMITFIGWIILMSSTIIILYHDLTLHKDIPSWCFFYAAASLWIYSTMDAIDGKQARRTKSSSPLGQLFDHGCDSFCVTFLIINLGSGAQLNSTHLFVGSYTAFWIANWKEYNTGVLLTNVGQFGVTETQILAIVMYIVTGVYGQNVWQFSIHDVAPASLTAGITSKPILELINHPVGGVLAYYYALLILALAIYELLLTLWKTRELKSMKECFSLFVLMINCSVWMYFSFFDKYVGIVLFSFGLMIALLVCKIIVSSVTKVRFRLSRCLWRRSTRSCCCSSSLRPSRERLKF